MIEIKPLGSSGGFDLGTVFCHCHVFIKSFSKKDSYVPYKFWFVICEGVGVFAANCAIPPRTTFGPLKADVISAPPNMMASTRLLLKVC